MPDRHLGGFNTVQEAVKEAEDKLVEAHHLIGYYKAVHRGSARPR
jgi:hypothetical protein